MFIFAFQKARKMGFLKAKHKNVSEHNFENHSSNRKFL